ncbi:hypothetical protein ACQY0O_004697 [Thecaphora frezii]
MPRLTRRPPQSTEARASPKTAEPPSHPVASPVIAWPATPLAPAHDIDTPTYASTPRRGGRAAKLAASTAITALRRSTRATTSPLSPAATQRLASEPLTTPARRLAGRLSTPRSRTPIKTEFGASPSASRRSSFTEISVVIPFTPPRGATPTVQSSDRESVASTDSRLRRSTRMRKRMRYDFTEPDAEAFVKAKKGGDDNSDGGDGDFVEPAGGANSDEDDNDEDVDDDPFDPAELAPEPPESANTSATRKARARQTPTSSSAKRKAGIPLRTPKRMRYDDGDDAEEEKGKLRFFEFTGTNAEHRARELSGASNKQRAYSYHEIWPLYKPPDLQVLEKGLIVNDNEDEPDQGDRGDDRAGIAWPRDGLARTRLQSDLPLAHRRLRGKYWTLVLGFIPYMLLHDMLWWPGKGFGYKEAMARTRWAKAARQSGRSGVEGKVGWPFVHPRLEIREVKFLTDSESSGFRLGKNGRHSARRPTLEHPIHVNGSAAPQAAKAGSGAKAGIIADDQGSDVDDAEDDDEAEAPVSKVDVDLEDPKFRDLSLLGLQERYQDPAESLQVWLGPLGQQQQVTLPPGTSTRLDPFLEDNEGHMLNVGGHVYALDWVPVPIHLNRGKEYVAISASIEPRPATLLGAREARPLPGRIQIWSVAPDEEMDDGVCKGKSAWEMNLCVNSGVAYSLAWSPVGHEYRESATDAAGGSASVRRLGLLAGVFQDGSVSIFAPPHPEDVKSSQTVRMAEATATAASAAAAAEPVYVKLEPVLRLELKSTAITCFDWAGGEDLAVGCANGYVAVFAVGAALRSGATSVWPHYYVHTHACAVTSVSWFMAPPIDVDGTQHPDRSPHLLFSVSPDGNYTLSNTLDGTVRTSEHQRHVHTLSAFCPFSLNFLNENGECNTTLFSMRPDEVGRQKGIASLAARVTAMAASAFHPSVALGSAAGEVKLTNAFRASRRSGNVKGHSVRAQTPLYRLITNRKTGHLKMLDNFVVEATSSMEDRYHKSPSLPPEVQITSARWNPNQGRALFLATGMGCGLVRLDWVRNRLVSTASS